MFEAKFAAVVFIALSDQFSPTIRKAAGLLALGVFFWVTVVPHLADRFEVPIPRWSKPASWLSALLLGAVAVIGTIRP